MHRRKNHWAACVFGMLTLCSSSGGGAVGFPPNARWCGDAVDVHLVLPRALSEGRRAELLATVKEAASSWAMPDVPVLRVHPAERLDRVAEDGVNEIVFERPRAHCPSRSETCLTTGMDAVTRPIVRAVGGRHEIIEADVSVDSALLAGDRLRLRAVAAHELGHVLGLGHACEKGRETHECAVSVMHWDVLATKQGADALPNDRDRQLLTTLYVPNVRAADASVSPTALGAIGILVMSTAGAGVSIARRRKSLAVKQ